jgi:hypothetical protein
MLLILAFLALLGQENDELQIHSFGSCVGKQIAHTLGTILFCIPRGMEVHRWTSFEGDTQDTITVSVRGKKGKLIVRTSSGPSGFRKHTPDWSVDDAAGQSSMRTWRCSDGDGRDFRLNRNQSYSRMMTFPLGWTEYNEVPLNIAVVFDRILDSLRCKPLTNR